MKKIVALLFAFVLVMSLFVGCGEKTETTDAEGTETTEGTNITDKLTKFEDKVLFTIDDTEIMLSSANILLYQIKNYYESIYGPTVWDMEAEPGVIVNDFVKNDIKDVSVRTEILFEKAKELGLEQSEEKLTELKDQAKSIFESYTPDIIEKYGFTLQVLEDTIVKQSYTELVFNEVMKDYVANDTDVQIELELNPSYVSMMKYGVEKHYDQVRARHILIKTVDDAGNPLDEATILAAKAKIDDILTRAKAGDDFATLATENTEDPGSKETGGEYTFGRGQMVTEFENAAYNLEVGGISDVVETQFGYHIIKLEERIPATEAQIEQAKQDLEGYKASAVDLLKTKEFNKIYETYLANYTVTTDEELWTAITFKDTAVTE
jgi:foldase protein PrsA